MSASASNVTEQIGGRKTTRKEVIAAGGLPGSIVQTAGKIKGKITFTGDRT